MLILPFRPLSYQQLVLEQVGEHPILTALPKSIPHVGAGFPNSRPDEEHANERTHLLPQQRFGSVSARHGSEVESIISSHISKNELALGNTAVGERLAYNDYTTIDCD